jgi:hypothetical protein
MLAPFAVLNGPGGNGYVIAGPGQVHGYGFADPAAGAGDKCSRGPRVMIHGGVKHNPATARRANIGRAMTLTTTHDANRAEIYDHPYQM